jgi:hypothetical protein
MISVRSRKWFLAVAPFVLSTALFASPKKPIFQPPPPPSPPPANHGCNVFDLFNCKPAAVPDGGSTWVYVLGVGAVCLGAVFVRSRAAKNQGV